MNKKILIVEDDKFLRELIAKKIGAEGYVAVEAKDGEEGLKKIEEEKPDLVLLDLVLPNMTGFDILASVKENPLLSEVPIVVLSNLGQRDDVDKAIGLGAQDFLIKAHFTPQEIVEKIKSALK
ncbi:MAG: response regulator [Candidatus Portnoybacteria bacterium]|nr:response regulator [Candidatus Portnoybacteria bacterium]